MARSSKQYCSFCGRSNSEVQLIHAPDGSVAICSECIDICSSMIHAEDSVPQEGKRNLKRIYVPDLVPPAEMKAYLDQYVIGQAASMGAVLLAAGSHGKRFALPNARIMVHQPSGGFGGTAADAEIQVNELLHYKTLLYDILAKHIGKPADQIKKDSDRDFFMSATAAQEYGVVDQVLPPNEAKR